MSEELSNEIEGLRKQIEDLEKENKSLEEQLKESADIQQDYYEALEEIKEIAKRKV